MLLVPPKKDTFCFCALLEYAPSIFYYALLYSFLALMSWIDLSDVQIDSRCAHEIAKELPIWRILVLIVI